MIRARASSPLARFMERWRIAFFPSSGGVIELIEGMVLVLFRITLPSAGRGKLAKTCPLHFEDEESVHGVEDQEVALAADTLVIRVIKPPSYRPGFAKAAEVGEDRFEVA